MVVPVPEIGLVLYVLEIVILFGTMFNVSIVAGRTPHLRDDFVFLGVALLGWTLARVLYPRSVR